MLGFDTLYEPAFNDKIIAEIAQNETRIVLTRDVGLLKQKQIKWGYWLRSQLLEPQLSEVVSHFRLTGRFQPFTRCLECNGLLKPVKKELVLEKLPPKTKLYFNEFYQCHNCERVYWKGSHYERMQQFIKQFQPEV